MAGCRTVPGTAYRQFSACVLASTNPSWPMDGLLLFTLQQPLSPAPPASALITASLASSCRRMEMLAFSVVQTDSPSPSLLQFQSVPQFARALKGRLRRFQVSQSATCSQLLHLWYSSRGPGPYRTSSSTALDSILHCVHYSSRLIAGTSSGGSQLSLNHKGYDQTMILRSLKTLEKV